ncbi:MAG: hypothetical protein QW632_01425 [Ignisphaera sp.]
MLRGNIIIRANCSDREQWIRLIKKGEVNAVDLCLEDYSKSEVEEMNRVLEDHNKVMIAYATPILNIFFLLVGRLLTLFKQLQKIDAEIVLNNRLLSQIKPFMQFKDIEPAIIEKQLRGILAMSGWDINIELHLRENRDGVMVVVGSGITYGNKSSEIGYRIELSTTKDVVSTSISSVIEILNSEAFILKGFKTFIDMGKIEGVYTSYISKLIEKRVVDLKEIF